MSEASIEELKELASLVWNGWLFDVQAWLADGKPFRTSARTRFNPILESVRTGFHSMVEVFLAAGLAPTERSALLAEAVHDCREDMVNHVDALGADLCATGGYTVKANSQPAGAIGHSFVLEMAILGRSA